MKRLIVATAVTVIATAGMATVAEAGPPAQKGCYGESLSALAKDQPAPGSFGHAVREFAQDPNSRPGLGDGVQALQAGFVPDDVVTNTCND